MNTAAAATSFHLSTTTPINSTVAIPLLSNPPVALSRAAATSDPSTFQKVSGVVKTTTTRLTGNQRKKRRIEQASKKGISESELLSRRRAKMEEWQNERSHLTTSRCPNCGAFSHNFYFCPFANDVPFRVDSVIRFRGPNGSWDGEPPLDLTLAERQRFKRHFTFLSMPLGPTQKKSTP